MDISLLFIIAVVLVGIIAAVVEVLKKTLTIASKFVPILSVIVGILIGIILQPLSEYTYYVMALAGALAGLASSGTFDLYKSVKSSKEGDQ